MTENLPAYIPLVFGFATVATLALFFWAVKRSDSGTTQQNAAKILAGLAIWLVAQAILALTNVYNSHPDSVPPKIVSLGISPPVLAIIALFTTRKGRHFIDSLPLAILTYLHIVRIPVELVLFWLSLHKAVPELMTFEGRNFDIIAGITAPAIAYFGFTKKKFGAKAILAWNFICLGLLINIVANAFLSTPSPLQQFAFDRPNVAILHFPFSWLPTFVVPIILFGHLAAIRQLVKRKTK